MSDSLAQERFEQAATTDEKLAVAFNAGELTLFIEALARGADVDRIPEGLDEPLILNLAKNGRLEWVEALIATERCTMIRDPHGLPPSYFAGLLARNVVGIEGAEDLAKRYAELQALLSGEERTQAVSDAIPQPSEP